MKISFLDFWPGFNNNNFFFHLFSMIEKVQITNPRDADIIIFSCFGNSNKSYMNKKRIFYTGENLRPDYDNIDFSFSFDFTDNGKNIRIPLWLLQIDWFNQRSFGNPQFMIPYDSIDKNQFSVKKKDKFCSIVFNNPTSNRLEIVEELSRYKKVECFGKPHGNWFYGEEQKLKTISNFKFDICFENSISPGYYTEKLIHAKVAGCVPIYWADDKINNDFNGKGFINLYDFNSIKELCNYIIEIDNDDEKYKQIKNEPLFNQEQDPKLVLDSIIEKIKNKKLWH